jgi:serine/threonine protein kinase
MLNVTDLIDRYEILAELGRGTMGVVYKARDPKIDRIVAIKTILLFGLNASDEQEYRRRFYEEARTAGRLSHPGIITVFDVEPNPENGKPYIVMEYVEGESLSRLLAHNEGRLPMGAALRLAQEIAEALHLAHSQGIVHRDIKPENILVTSEGRAKIADFGIARMDQSNLTLPGRVLGSPAYMSPEQLNGEHTDARSDLFSLGVVLYTMLTGHRPFQGNSTATVCFKVTNRDALPVSSWNLDFPQELDELVARAMAKNPAQRFQTGMEMARELQQFREEHESEPQPLASIMRIIGQERLADQHEPSAPQDKPLAVQHGPSAEQHEPLAIQKTAIKEEKADSVSIFDPRSAIIPSEPSQQRAQAVVVARVSKKASNGRVALLAAHASSPKAVAITAAALVVFAGFAFWSKQKHSRESEGPSPTAVTRTISPSPEMVPEQPTPTSNSVADHEIKRPQSANADAARAIKSSKLQAPSAQRHVSTTPKVLVQSDVNSSTGAADGASVQDSVTVHMIHMADLRVTIDHSFEEAQASIFVDNREVYNEELHAEKKRRALVFSRTEGHQSGTITLLPGKHDIVARVQSPDYAYDATERLTQSFAPGSNHTLIIKCDKRKKRLELSVK